MPGLPAPGKLIAHEDLTVQRARDIANLVVSVSPPFTRLVECRRRTDSFEGDVLVLELDVEVPQHPVHRICRRELIAVTFMVDDQSYPEVEALRGDFPQVPHLNMRSSDVPKSLCLYEEPWEALELRWSPGAYLERIREWLALTARGKLHAPDQALEPFFLAARDTLVLGDAAIRDALRDLPSGVWTTEYDAGGGRTVFLAEASANPDDDASAPSVIMATTVNPRTAGVIRRTPKNLADLHELLVEGGDDFVGQLCARFAHWSQRGDLLEKQLILLLVVPITRSPDGPKETSEVRAFRTNATVAEAGVSIGLWQEHEGSFGRLLGPAPSSPGLSIELSMLNVVHKLSREGASRLNGIGETSTNVVAIGVGALGSQVCLNLARAGWGQWTYIDQDYVLPHNLARHALPGFCVGMPKASTLAFVVNDIIEGDPLATSIVANVLRPSTSREQLRESLSGAGLILDMSASVPVARAMAHDFESTARRVSIFLNPSGSDLVVLAESADRALRLDSLEMQYYRALIDRSDLSNHLTRPEQEIRYGQACRDVSFVLSQEMVALHASIGARITRQVADQPDASIAIFRADPNCLTVSRVDVATSTAVEQQFGEWRVVTDEVLLDRVATCRKARLPNETGGVLLGSVDAQRRIVYAVAALPSPTDSEEWPTSYIRGTQGLAQQLEYIRKVTDDQIEYIGEWHSHPDGSGVSPSDDDGKALSYLSELRAADGRPAVFLIVGESDCGWCLDGVDRD